MKLLYVYFWHLPPQYDKIARSDCIYRPQLHLAARLTIAIYRGLIFIMKFLSKIFGTKNDREVRKLQSIVEHINSLEAKIQALDDDGLKNQTVIFKNKIEQGATTKELLPEAFATVREASRRTLGQRHYDVQLIGGMILHDGKIAEMKTGEGKTLTATLPVYLHGLVGRGAHVVTVNDYLAKRDAEWMAQVYNFLGLSVGKILHGLSDRERQEAYGSDITYGTNNEFGFDYLRDNMKTDLSRFAQRDHYFAIVDEVDSILIDEARTPLIISGPAETATDLYVKVNSAIPGLQRDSDYILDEKSRTTSLTEDGINKLEKRLAVENLYDPAMIDVLHHTQQALKAHVLFKKDVDYVVRDGQVVIVDEFTGRLMPGRRYSDGLHGALEAKEHVQVQNETQTLATITFQNYFRLYDVLSGMTGTADTEAVEFKKIYNLDVTVIPTNRPLQRKDHEDVVYRSRREKFNALADDIAEISKKGQPVLVGTVSVEKSELLSQLLKKRNIRHEILNAKNHAREAQIIEASGQLGSVTISTNMAGRGTDIVLGEGVPERGGLYVIGTERHESRRIDNQLRGRSGRQGDPGATKFYLSLEDDLMRIFGSDRLSNIMGRLGMEEGEAIIAPMVSRAIERAQSKVEQQNFSSRKHLLEYDDVMNQQRQVIYGRRRQALDGKLEIDFIKSTVHTLALQIAMDHQPENTSSWDFEKISTHMKSQFNVAGISFDELDSKECTPEALAEVTSEAVLKSYESKSAAVGSDIMKRIECHVYLTIIDQAWKDHLLAMDTLKDSVSLRGYGQRDPLQEYKKEAFNLFTTVWARIEEETTLTLVRMPPPQVTYENPLEQSEPDESQLNFSHPDHGSSLNPSGPGPSRGGQDESQLIYHGSRETPAPKEAPKPYTREQEKVGRNDPCPCGSGKKYKKCHGSTASANASESSI